MSCAGGQARARPGSIRRSWCATPRASGRPRSALSASGWGCRLEQLREELVDRDRPAGQGRLGLRALAASIDTGGVRVARAVDTHHVRAEQIDVPDDLRAGREVV